MGCSLSWGGAERKVAIVCNEWDLVFASRLLAPLAKVNIATKFFDSWEPELNLDALAEDYQGTVIVGDIRAPGTDRVLHPRTTWHKIQSYKQGPSLGELDLEKPRDYSDYWNLGRESGNPFWVLAGGTREGTCRAVVEFITDVDEAFSTLVKQVRGGRTIKTLSSR